MFFACLLTFLYSCGSNDEFVTVRDGKLFIGDKPYCYVGTNFWYGAILGSQGQCGDRTRLIRELDFLADNGIKNLRILVGGDGKDGIPSRIQPTLQKGPGLYNDEILDGLDFLMKEMGSRGMRAVLYLNNSWEWSGGYSQYLEWAGAGEAPNPSVDGWNVFTAYVKQYAQNVEAQNLFSQYVSDIITRTNRYTGKRYVDDPTIMSWQIGNEPRAFSDDNKEAFVSWMSKVAAQIKSIDKNHLVSTGSEGKAGCEGDLQLYERLHADLNIDYMTVHIWPKNWGWINEETIETRLQYAIENTKQYVDEHAEMARRLDKPLVLEEFGYPRDGQNFRPGSKTQNRDKYYESVFAYIKENYDNDGNFVGCNFWGWGGFAKISDNHVFWMVGDDYTGDPAQEEQGLNSVFSQDKSTIEIVSKYSRILNKT